MGVCTAAVVSDGELTKLVGTAVPCVVGFVVKAVVETWHAPWRIRDT